MQATIWQSHPHNSRRDCSVTRRLSFIRFRKLNQVSSSARSSLCRSFLSEFRMQIASVSAPKSDQGLICIHISRFQVANCHLHSPLIRLTRWLDLLTDPVPTKHDLSILLGVRLKVNYADQILTVHMYVGGCRRERGPRFKRAVRDGRIISLNATSKNNEWK